MSLRGAHRRLGAPPVCQSASRVGNCWDNSVVESFFASLKRELVARRRFATRDQARREIFAWIGRYNTQLHHSSLANPTGGSSHRCQGLPVPCT